MPASGTKLADANVWLAAVFSDHQHHLTAKQWFTTQPDGGCAFCRITQLALLRHLSNSKIMGTFVQGQRNAWRTYETLANDARVIFVDKPPGIETVFQSLSQSISPSRDLWTDAYLAAFALARQAQLVTFDKGFSRFPGLDLPVLA